MFGKLNAFTFLMLNELLNVFDTIEADNNLKAVIISGTGRGFCAGADLTAQQSTDMGWSSVEDALNKGYHIGLNNLVYMDKVVISAVEGSMCRHRLCIPFKFRHCCDVKLKFLSGWLLKDCVNTRRRYQLATTKSCWLSKSLSNGC